MNDDSPDHYDDLRAHTRETLAGMSDSEMSSLRDMARVWQSMQTLGALVKWLFLGLLAIIIAINQMGDQIVAIFARIRGH